VICSNKGNFSRPLALVAGHLDHQQRPFPPAIALLNRQYYISLEELLPVASACHVAMLLMEKSSFSDAIHAELI
jgi:hypothetical protein